MPTAMRIFLPVVLIALAGCSKTTPSETGPTAPKATISSTPAAVSPASSPASDQSVPAASNVVPSSASSASAP